MKFVGIMLNSYKFIKNSLADRFVNDLYDEMHVSIVLVQRTPTFLLPWPK